MKHRQLFLAPLLRRGSLVFDVGANIGEFTAAFLSVGVGKVVAFEPLPELCEHLKTTFRRSVDSGCVVIRGNAVGSAPGIQTLTQSSDRSKSMSSLSPVFIGVSKGNGDAWNEANRFDVTVVTLDNMIVEYGTPDYIKIDVEGYDLEVIKGLNTPVRLLSFEYNTQPKLIDIALACIDRISQIGDYEFNFQAEAPDMAFLQLEHWVSPDVMRFILSSDVARAVRYGDVFCRLRSPG